MRTFAMNFGTRLGLLGIVLCMGLQVAVEIARPSLAASSLADFLEASHVSRAATVRPHIERYYRERADREAFYRTLPWIVTLALLLVPLMRRPNGTNFQKAFGGSRCR